MQAVMHFIVGILLFHAIENLVIAFIVIFLSHYVVDILVKVTYHPKDPQPQSKFWVGYHIFLLILTIIAAILFIRVFWVMLVSMIRILSTGFIRPVLRKTPVYPLIERIRESKLFAWIPTDYEPKHHCRDYYVDCLIRLLFSKLFICPLKILPIR